MEGTFREVLGKLNTCYYGSQVTKDSRWKD
jgi:hypothetical protein